MLCNGLKLGNSRCPTRAFLYIELASRPFELVLQQLLPLFIILFMINNIHQIMNKVKHTIRQ